MTTVPKHIIGRIKAIWNDAINIDGAGPCHCKRKAAMYSFQLERFEDERLDEQGRERCGYWCVACGFSNAGSRPVNTEAAIDGERE